MNGGNEKQTENMTTQSKVLVLAVTMVSDQRRKGIEFLMKHVHGIRPLLTHDRQ